MGQSEEFQQFNYKRNIYSGHSKGSNEVTSTATIREGNYGHLLRCLSPDLKGILRSNALRLCIESNITSCTDVCRGGSVGSQVSLSTPVLPLPHVEKKGESRLSCG